MQIELNIAYFERLKLFWNLLIKESKVALATIHKYEWCLENSMENDLVNLGLKCPKQLDVLIKAVFHTKNA